MAATVPRILVFTDLDGSLLDHNHGQPYRNIRRILSNIRHQHGFRFTGFGDLTEDQDH